MKTTKRRARGPRHTLKVADTFIVSSRRSLEQVRAHFECAGGQINHGCDLDVRLQGILRQLVYAQNSLRALVSRYGKQPLTPNLPSQ